MNYYKATKPDGTDFRTGTIDYAAALESGEVIRHPAAKKVRDDASTYLSVSISPSDCTGFLWPCRLFRVEPVGRVMSNLTVSNSKRAVSALRVVEELPAWQAFGPNGDLVVAVIERLQVRTPQETARLAAAWAAVWAADRDAAWDAAWAAVWAADRDAAWAAAWAADKAAAWLRRAADRAAAWDAAGALVVHDLLAPQQFKTLYGPYGEVIEELEMLIKRVRG